MAQNNINNGTSKNIKFIEYSKRFKICDYNDSNFCDFNDAYILVRGDITVTASPQIQVAFKNNAPFINALQKIDETTIDNAENLDLVMPMYNLIEYSSNHSEVPESL